MEEKEKEIPGALFSLNKKREMKDNLKLTEGQTGKGKSN